MPSLRRTPSRIEPLETRLAFSIVADLPIVPDTDRVPRVTVDPIIQLPTTLAGTWYASIALTGGKSVALVIDVGEVQPDGQFTATLRFAMPDGNVEVVDAVGGALGKDCFCLTWEQTRVNTGRIQGQFLPSSMQIPAFINWRNGVELIQSDLPMARPMTGDRPLAPTTGQPGGTVIGSLADWWF